MAVYEFRCRECGKKFEVTQPITEYNPRRVKCPKCGSRKVARRYGAVSAITSKKS